MKNLHSTQLAALAVGAFALGGCATTHVDGDWQCPLTQGSPCLSVSSADPAAPGNHTSPGAGAQPIGADVLQNADAPQSSDANRLGSRRSAGRRAAGRRPSPAYRSIGNAPESGGTGTEEGPELETAVEGDVEIDPAPAGAPGDLRTPEVIGRIWIAPYVDANGVYREASWVRVVLEPARWRLP